MLFSFAAVIISMVASAQDSTYKEMTGKYKFPAGSVIDEAIVTWDNNVLTMNSSAGSSALERIKGDTFNVVTFNGICVFKRDEAKKINGVHVDASGYVLDGTKDATTLSAWFDITSEESLIRIKEQLSQWIPAHTATLRKPFLALVYN